MVCPCLADTGHAKGLVLVIVLRQLLRARLINHLRQTKSGCPNNGQCLLINSVPMCLNIQVLVLLCLRSAEWHCIFIFHELLFRVAASHMSRRSSLLMTCLQSEACPPLTIAETDKGDKGRADQSKNPRQSWVSYCLQCHYLPHILCICHLENCFL